MIAAAVLVLAAQTPPEPRQSVYVGQGATDKYRMLYGEPVYWSLSLLVGPDGGGAAGEDRPSANQAIETRGVLSVFPRAKGEPDVRLCEETLRHCLRLTGAVPEIRAEFFADAPFRNLHEASVTGAFTPDEGFIYWRVDSAPRDSRAARGGPGRTLEQVVRAPERFVGGPVTLRGSFGGAAEDGGWLLRDGPFFIRVAGREARGNGWRLDGRSRADCVWQLEVRGTVERRQGDLRLSAREVRLVGRDPDTSCAPRPSP